MFVSRQTLSIAVALVALMTVTATVSVHAEGTCGSDSSAYSSTPGDAAANLIFLVDTSGSMSQEAAGVRDGLNTFINEIKATGVSDLHIHMIANFGNSGFAVCVDPPAGGAPCSTATVATTQNPGGKYWHHDLAVGSWDSFMKFIPAIDTVGTDLKPNARTFIIVVSDDTERFDNYATSDPQQVWDNFKAAMQAHPNYSTYYQDFVMNGVIYARRYNTAGDSSSGQCSGIASVSQPVLIGAADTGGATTDMCDWTNKNDPVEFREKLLDPLVQTVANTVLISCEYSGVPAEFNHATVVWSGDNRSYNDQYADATNCGTSHGYYVVGDKLHLCPATCTEVRGFTSGQVNVNYFCSAAIPSDDGCPNEHTAADTCNPASASTDKKCVTLCVGETGECNGTV